jgi:hypothetical protein
MKNRTIDYLPEHASPSSSASTEGNGWLDGKLPFGKADVQQWVAPVEKLVRDYPGAALAAAFAIGVTIAWFVKRK